MTKNHKRQMEWTMRVIKSFEGDLFTSHGVVDRWRNYSPVRYQPTASAVTILLKRLTSLGLVRKTGEPVRYATAHKSTSETQCYVEVTLER